MRKVISLILVHTVLLFAISCEEEAEDYGTINYIGYGTSFGECLGYCIHHMKLYPESVRLDKAGWDEQGELPIVQCSRPVELFEYVAIRDSIDVNSFFFMEETIGCPDCADGGAEWIEISYDTAFHRVTFEYQNEPQELSYVVSLLRDMMSEFEGCSEE